MSETSEKLKSEDKEKTKEPAKYAVVFHNDNYTTMDFVISLLVGIFNKDKDSAKDLTLQIHIAGRGVAGVYPFEIAEEKYLLVKALAEKNEQPLRVSMEEV